MVQYWAKGRFTCPCPQRHRPGRSAPQEEQNLANGAFEEPQLGQGQFSATLFWGTLIQKAFRGDADAWAFAGD